MRNRLSPFPQRTQKCLHNITLLQPLSGKIKYGTASKINHYEGSSKHNDFEVYKPAWPRSNLHPAKFIYPTRLFVTCRVPISGSLVEKIFDEFDLASRTGADQSDRPETFALYNVNSTLSSLVGLSPSCQSYYPAKR